MLHICQYTQELILPEINYFSELYRRNGEFQKHISVKTTRKTSKVKSFINPTLLIIEKAIFQVHH